VPAGTPTIVGPVNITLNVQGSKFYYNTSYYPTGTSSEQQQYIEIAVVVILMLIMIIFVRSPYRDEFYIDILNLPEEKKTKIMLKASDVVGAFDKLNTQYHWKYMPLSKAEVRAAIQSNIRYSNMPVGLTYNNIEKIIDQMVVKKQLNSADNLYAPARWNEQSGHDIGYLATFKKLRIFLVTHAYIFSDLDVSAEADMVVSYHNERKFIVIHSKTSKFQKVPIYAGWKTYIVFLNSYKMEDFRNYLYNSNSEEAEELKMYISAGMVRLIDADNPKGLLE